MGGCAIIKMGLSMPIFNYANNFNIKEKAMSKVTAKKRIIIAAALFGVFIIGALVSIVLVLAAQTQNVKTSISISYVVDGVGADVGFRYAMIPTDTATDQTITPISQVINEFGVSEAEREQDLGGIAEGTLAFSSE